MNLVHFTALNRTNIAKPRHLLRQLGSFAVSNSWPELNVTNLI